MVGHHSDLKTLRCVAGALLLAFCFVLLFMSYDSALYRWWTPDYGSLQYEEGGINDTCGCFRSVGRMEELAEDPVDWCSPHATQRGYHQNVVSYSLYGNSSHKGTVDRYFKLLEPLAQSIQQFYPGWTMRVYHNFENDDTLSMNHLCSIHCRYSHVDLCQVQVMQNDPRILEINNSSRWDKLNPRMSRFLAAADPQVDLFISRDIDADMVQREVDAVHQWLSSNYTFHLMRDHQYHTDIVLAGMWGAKVYANHSFIQDLVLKMVRDGTNPAKSTDQDMLRKHFWPVAKYDILAHDSYTCRSSKVLKTSALPTFPFPTQRNKQKDFVGNVVTAKDHYRNILAPCPEACRPPSHPDWKYC